VRLIKFSKIVFYFLALAMTLTAFGQISSSSNDKIVTEKSKENQKLTTLVSANNKQKKKDNNNTTLLPIRSKIISALTLSKNNSKLAAQQISNLSLLNTVSSSQLKQTQNKSLNAAEQYLLLIAKAYQANHVSDYKSVINCLTDAEMFNKSIAKKQLSQPLFYQLHWLLAETYAVLGDFDQAYEQKRIYLNKYARNDRVVKNKLVSLLNKKYKTKQRIKENELLEQQNKLEREKITQISNSKNQRKRNTLILIFIAIVFFGMMYRQYRVKRQLILINRIDLLTGLCNRQALFYLGKRLFKESQEDKSQLSVIYFDCDDFKKINDDYGYQIVDEILKVIAILGNDVMRSRDVFARIGSQEFVILLPEDNLAQAKAVAEHLREKIAQYDYSSLGVKEGLSASFGIVSNDKITSDFESLLKAANLALLKAKDQGGNKAVCFEEPFFTNEKLSIRATNSAATEQKS